MPTCSAIAFASDQRRPPAAGDVDLDEDLALLSLDMREDLSAVDGSAAGSPYSDLPISSVIFLASPRIIIVLSR